MNALSILNRMRNPKYYSVQVPQGNLCRYHEDSCEPMVSPRSLFAPFLSCCDDFLSCCDDSYRMLQEKDGQYTVSFDVPGVSKEDLNIDIDNNTLVVATASKETKEPSEHTERATRQYRFCTSIPKDVDHENITAKMENGVLTIHLPISESDAPKKISIQ